jgi:hypothetical protein
VKKKSFKFPNKSGACPSGAYYSVTLCIFSWPYLLILDYPEKFLEKHSSFFRDDEEEKVL